MFAADSVDVAAFGETKQMLRLDTLMLVPIVFAKPFMCFRWTVVPIAAPVSMAGPVVVPAPGRMSVVMPGLYTRSGRSSPRLHLNGFLAERFLPGVSRRDRARGHGGHNPYTMHYVRSPCDVML